MSDTLNYQPVEALQALSTAELRALWELVPTDRQRQYRAAYDRELKAAGAEGSDAKERQLASALLKRYAQAALVPIGIRWARAPGRVQEAAKRGDSLDVLETTARPKTGRPNRMVVVVGMGFFLLVAFMLVRGISSRNASPNAVAPTATSPGSITPTALALEAQDDVIEGGDAVRAPLYPINLQVSVGSSADSGVPPRVWVVQRRAVRASQWNYDPNPDTASFLNGMQVRPVIGIPWSEENAAWFAEVRAGATFRVQMNTGAVLTFAFESKREVRRSETDIFRQVQPGLVLLLLGETDEEGMPTATRTLITASYAPEQELSRSGELLGALAVPALPSTPTPVPPATPTLPPLASLNVQVVRVSTTDGQLTLQLRLYNDGATAAPIRPDGLWVALGYAENPPGPRLPADGVAPFDLLPGQAADMTLIWPWQGEPYASFGVGGYRYALHLVER